MKRLEASPGLTRILVDSEATMLMTGIQPAMEFQLLPLAPELMKIGSTMEEDKCSEKKYFSSK